MSWQKVIKEFKGKNKHEGLGSAACLVLMYLAFGQCWAYKMANEFKLGLIPENGWKEEQLKYFSKLKDVDQLNVLLNNMERKGLLKSNKEETGRRRRFFRLNEDIIISYLTNKGSDSIFRELSKSEGLPTNGVKERDLVFRFLNELSGRSRDIYFRHWSKIEIFDYLTFLGFSKQEALDMKNEEMAKLLKKIFTASSKMKNG